MKGISLCAPADLQPSRVHPVPGHSVVGSASMALASPGSFALWCVLIRLDEGSIISWNGAHGEEAFYVISGSLSGDGTSTPTRGAIIVEALNSGEIVATERTEVAHFGSYDLTPPGDVGAQRHIVGPEGVYRVDEIGRDTHFYNDEDCTSCSMSLHYTERTQPWVVKTHSHSQDEILYVVQGEVQLGSYRMPAGSTIAIAAGRRYGFRSGPAGHLGFINYRPALSYYSGDPKAGPVAESPVLQGFTRVDGA